MRILAIISSIISIWFACGLASYVYTRRETKSGKWNDACERFNENDGNVGDFIGFILLWPGYWVIRIVNREIPRLVEKLVKKIDEHI